MLEGKKWTAHVEINSWDFFLWLLYGFLPKHINLWGKMQSFKQEKVRSTEIRKKKSFGCDFYKVIAIKWQ
jgi:hypothetical protein